MNHAISSDTSPVRFTVNSGDTPHTIAQNLVNSALITDAQLFVDYAQLNELDTAAVPPMSQVAVVADGKEPDLRPDEVAPSLSRERVLACAPDTDQVFFKVPKVIER